ncbi:MAG: hypothetical protein JWO19_3916 [Bryobacterales bacterium]|jgi:hypothetical protein|nr:hypothetical protein [Bryobacterales bacterium]
MAKELMNQPDLQDREPMTTADLVRQSQTTDGQRSAPATVEHHDPLFPGNESERFEADGTISREVSWTSRGMRLKKPMNW